MKLVKPVRVAPGLYQLRTLGAKVTAILSGTDVVLVDAGGPGSLGLIASGLDAMGLSLKQVRLIVVTHYHPDHTGSLRVLAEVTGAQVAAHGEEASIINGEEPLPNPFRNQLMAGLTGNLLRKVYDPVTVDLLLNDGDALPIGEGIVAIHTPGHTRGSICLYAASQRTLIVGDALQHRFGRLSPPSAAVTEDPTQARQSLRRLTSMQFDTICFSHFPPLKHDAQGTLHRLVQKLGP